MKFIYRPKTALEKSAKIIYNLLVDNFPRTFFVGGMVRDLVLGKKITDVDIATSARPEQVVLLLAAGKFKIAHQHPQQGVETIIIGNREISIASFRRDLPAQDRYPAVLFTNSAKIDSLRRDFTINALYLSQKSDTILDFHNGLKDLDQRLIRFIGNPAVRIQEDPLRIVRAFRFAIKLRFSLEKNTEQAIIKQSHLLRSLSTSRIKKEIDKLKTPREKNELKKILDKFFK